MKRIAARHSRCRSAFLIGAILCLFQFLGLAQNAHRPAVSANGTRTALREGWQLHSSCGQNFDGATLSTEGFHQDSTWISTTVPSTVLAAQIAAGQFKDPFFGMNLRDIPGTDYPIGKIFTNLPMSESSPYHCSWWYRKEFSAPQSLGGKTWLRFEGVNYRANIWLNGKKLADAQQVAGAYRAYDFEVSRLLQPGKNVVAVEVFAQTETDLGINFVDWNHGPADKSMGLWREVYLDTTGPVVVRNPYVITHFADDELKTADLTVVADVENATEHAVKAVVRAQLLGKSVEQDVELAGNEKRVVRFAAEAYPQLHVKNPKVWWPAQYGTPHLETLAMSARVNGRVSSEKNIRFGIREVQGELNGNGYRQFRINRKNILIRGAGWAPDLFYREPKKRIRQELEYVQHMGLNTVRLEGKLGSEEFFNLTDEMGILVMAGWCCCDHWEHWDKWTADDHKIANASLASQISRLRAHPSVFVWLNGSDGPPPADVESDYIRVLKERDWVNPFVSSASAKPTTVTGASGVKMSGPYDYVPPEYWYLDKAKLGGAYGFNTETSPGPAIPPIGSIRRTLPEKSLWPQDEVWNFHAAIGKFGQYNIFNAAMESQLGKAGSLEDYNRKAQWMAYDGERAMFEAYSANKYTSTGVIQWMLNNAWPAFMWHLYDYYLVPAGGYFGTRKANEPVHVQYRYDERTVDVVNSTLVTQNTLKVTARVFTLAGNETFSKEQSLDLPPDSVARTITIPEQPAASFLKLELRNAAGKLLSENFYVLTKTLADLQWDKSNYFYTPATQYADMSALQQLPKADLQAKVQEQSAGNGVLRLTNRGKGVAFLVQAYAVDTKNGELIAPIFWSDNFVSLLPNESRVLRFTIPEVAPSGYAIKLEGWNVDPQLLNSAKLRTRAARNGGRTQPNKDALKGDAQ
ncbi:MAG TPA: beta galactosidase jelly roll domain-containing protein [Candidatus Acidoferrales bacterium]|nr:beta galactosidase jelly roll domain-containing protein [Candidatus Acidoferrales bacterium]